MDIRQTDKHHIYNFQKLSLQEASVGDTVLLAIPDMDRGRCEFPHLKAVIIELKEGGLYKLGSKSGILDTVLQEPVQPHPGVLPHPG